MNYILLSHNKRHYLQMDYNDLMYDFSIVIFLHFRFKLLLISLHTIYKKESILSLYNSAKFLQPKSKSPLPSSNFIYTPFLNILYIIDKNMFSYPSIPFSYNVLMLIITFTTKGYSLHQFFIFNHFFISFY